MLTHDVKQILVVFKSNDHMFLSRGYIWRYVDDFVHASMCQVYGDAEEIRWVINLGL